MASQFSTSDPFVPVDLCSHLAGYWEPPKCPHVGCDYADMREERLFRHLHEHCGQTPHQRKYVCPWPRCTGRSSRCRNGKILRAHLLKTHITGPQYPCPYLLSWTPGKPRSLCATYFPYHLSLIKHMREVHGYDRDTGDSIHPFVKLDGQSRDLQTAELVYENCPRPLPKPMKVQSTHGNAKNTVSLAKPGLDAFYHDYDTHQGNEEYYETFYSGETADSARGEYPIVQDIWDHGDRHWHLQGDIDYFIDQLNHDSCSDETHAHNDSF